MKDEMDALVDRTAQVSDADVEALSLRAAETDLMEEIMSTPILESLPGAEPPRPRRTARRWVALAGAAAAVTAGTFVAQSGDDSPAWAAELLEVAESAPRLLLDDPAWEITRADEFGVEAGETTFGNGTHELDLFWRPGEDYESLLADRRHDIDHEESVTVAGHEAILIQYSGGADAVGGDSGPAFTTLWEQDGYAMEAVSVTFDDQDAYEAVLGLLGETDVDGWLSAMPASVIQPQDQATVVAEMLTGIPTPDGFDPGTLPTDGVRDRYQVGARVTGAVACQWIEQWAAATEAGDAAEADEAVAAMATSRDWPVLQEMVDEGGYPEVVWEYADAIANDGLDVEGESITREVNGGDVGVVGIAYREGLGCG